MSRRSWKNLLAKISAQQSHSKKCRPIRLSVEQLEELTLPSSAKAFPTFILSTHKTGDSGIHPLDGPGAGALTPAQIRGAYGINSISFNGTAGTGVGQTIAIVDAYDDPNIATDLANFDSFYGLQTMNGAGGVSGNPTFTKVGADSNGNASSLPPADFSGWSTEIALDVEWAHVVAPQANIVLVEAQSASNSALLGAVSYAATKSGASVVSMSWGESEFSGESSFNSYFTTAGVTFFAASGDNGSPIIWPAASPDVVGVGGTSLTVGTGNTYGGESVWNSNGGSTGGGLSSMFAAPSYQSGLVISNGTGTISANGRRASPDVAYDADPNTGVGVLDTWNAGQGGGWFIVGGTSAASPQWAALTAIVNQGRAQAGQGSLTGFSQTLPALYKLPSADFHDITSGNNGTYSAGHGFDLVTGWGSPVSNLLVPALAGFSAGNPPGITSPASFTLAAGGKTAQLTVSAAANPTSDPLSYTWSLTGTPPATVSFSPNGTGTSNNTTATFSKVGTYNFLVTVTDTANGQSVTSAVRGTVTALVSSVTVAPATVSIYDTKTQQFTATAIDQFGAALAPQPSFAWSVPSGTTTGTTGIGSVSASGGLYTAPGDGTGSATVQATDAGVSGSGTVNFSPAPLPPTITSGASFTLAAGGTTAQLTVSAAANPTSDPLSYTWSLTGTPPATVSFSPNGTGASNNTTATFSKVGTYNFLVTVKDTANGLSVTSAVTGTVTALVSSVTVAPATVSIYDTKTQQFTATAIDQFGAALAPQPSFAWSVPSGTTTGTTGIGSVSASGGLYTAPGDGTGSATVQATDAGVSGSGTVSFSPAPAPPTISSVTATPGLTTASLVVTASDTGGTITSYTWTVTSAPAGAPAVSFSPNGTLSASTTTVTLGAAGTYTFQVTVLDSNNLTAMGTVSVTITPVLTYVVVTPANVTLAPSATQQFSAAAQDQFHNAFSNPPSTTWSTASGSSITAAGLYTAPSTGSTDTVTAAIGGVSGTATITIVSNTGVLFSDNFANGLGKWTIDSGIYLDLPYITGYRLQSINNWGVNRIVAGSSSWTNYSYQGIVNVAHDNGGGSVSLLARVVDDSHLYFFGYSSYYGEWFIARKDGPNVTTMLAFSAPFAAYYHTDWTVQANLYGSSLSLYVNGVYETSVTDSTYAAGKIGFSTTSMYALLGNVVVTALNGPMVVGRLTVSGTHGSTPAERSSERLPALPPGAFVSGYAPGANQLFSSAFSLSGWSYANDLATVLGDPFWEIFGVFGK